MINESKTGACGVRKNGKGRLFLTVYGRPSALQIDPIEKKPLFHFLPGTRILSLGTIGCNFFCEFCQNWQLSQQRNEDSHAEEIMPKTLVDICLSKKIPSIAFTYNEPTIFFEYADDTAELAKKEKIKTIFVTNGYESKECMAKLKIDAMNIDLKSFSDGFYRRVCKAELQPVLETIRLAKKKKIWIEITTLVIPGENDSEEELRGLAEFIASVDKNIPWHVTAFHPDYKFLGHQSTPLETLDKARRIGLDAAGLNYVYIGNTPADESTYCPKCKNMIIKRQGFSAESLLANGKCPFCKTKIPGVWK